ncbi:cytochrome P450 [Pseudomassariella vexata]|uniref:Bifunctional cytochrome P450/NADPH--P450 reductase n=1 Tax=Pseudomassariella vexata TaxID=1141098 RepID=A0A1Y2DCL9_9PEZI|nr:cytochrome P450 [Pseudomassariella vexata]ORY56856.1 cytochrome P450 [Pseudomassariella vexata]
MAEIVPIPEPPGLPIIGNVGDIDKEFPLGSFMSLAEKYGEVYRLHLPGRSVVFCSTHALIDELCDEKRFKKVPTGVLYEIRNGVHDGLFTAMLEEPNWGIAHRVLMPAFGPMSIRGMFDEMHDIASQLVMKWARHGSHQRVLVTDDFTRLTLDTLALCAMGFRFNSYYANEMHPFIDAMANFLTESGARISRPPLPSFFYRNQDARYWQDIEILRQTATTVLHEREANPSDRKDLLAAMLAGRDPKTGEKMTDASIVDNLITFLIAGHETTSGMLSFAIYQLLKHPDEYRKVQEEVDRVIGKGPVTVDHMSKLPYIEATLRETLRLCSPINVIQVRPIEDTLLAGKYPVNKGEAMSLLLSKAHQDPAAFGDDALDFKPERMLDEPFRKLPKNAWKPFGNGVRGCIGRPFAWQEALIIMALLFQNFNFVMDDPNYQLMYNQTLTIKPKGFYIRTLLRDGLTPIQLEHRLAGTPLAENPAGKAAPQAASADAAGHPLTVLYGSNSGTCESMAQRLAADASQHGFKATTMDCMDAANGNLPTDQPVVVITASYEGQAPDNASHFVSWVENIKDKTALSGVSYAVFGCGHHDWASTFYRIPKLVDAKLEEAGATRLVKMGLSDAGGFDMFADFESWEDDVLWPALKLKYGSPDRSKTNSMSGVTLKVSVSTPRSSTLRQDVKEAEIVNTRILTADGEPIKRHVEIKLPTDLSYRSGDYLAVLPINPRPIVLRAMRKFELAWDSCLTIEGEGTSLPTGIPLPANDILSAYVELAQPATKRNIVALAEATSDKKDQETFMKLSGDSYNDEIASKRVSILDLIEKYPSVKLPLVSFLGMLPPMRVRQYSISSSPLWNPNHVTLTFSLLNEPSKSGLGVHMGVATSYLNSLEVGNKLHVSVRSSHAAFHLPSDLENVPVICIAAGTGLAPFRGFIQERAAMIGAGRKLAPALLYYGCREPAKDDLYTEELAVWEKLGAVAIKRAYSRTPEKSDSNSKYVQDALWADRENALKVWEDGAKLFVCGSRKVGEGVKDVVLRIRREDDEKEGRVVEEGSVEKWWEALRNVRYATDVFD